MKEEWRVQAKRADFNAIGQEFNIDPVVARVIRNRDIEDIEDIRKYLNGNLGMTYEPSLIKGMDKGCRLMASKISESKSIRIISDYDVDGVMSNYILLDGLKNAGANVSYEIPDRMTDGYGINERIINDAHNDGIDTIITCDNGIAAFSAIELAKEYNMTVIVTDHHEVPYDLDENNSKIFKIVPADVVIDIKQEDCQYPFKELCGAAVSYKFIKHLYKIMNLPWEEEDLYMEFVGMATLCDVMELKDENRIFVKSAMRKIRETNNIGLKCLVEANGLADKPITSMAMGFILGPCINATGRLESAKRGLSLLIATDKEYASKLAAELVEINQERKQMTEAGMKEAFDLVDNTDIGKDNVLVVYLPTLHESIAGIVAGRVREKYYKPVFVITNAENNMVKGSGRSISGYHMFEKMNECKELLEKFGGHELAAGLSLKPDNLDKFRKRLNELSNLSDDILTPKVFIDVPMPIKYIHLNLVEQLKLLEPFGKGNEKPIFGVLNLKVKKLQIFGKNKNVASILFEDENGFTIKGVNFDANTFCERIKEWFSSIECDKILQGKPNLVALDVIYYPDINEYAGMRNLQLLVTNYKKHEF